MLRLRRLIVLPLVLALPLACGGDDGGGGNDEVGDGDGDPGDGDGDPGDGDGEPGDGDGEPGDGDGEAGDGDGEPGDGDGEPGDGDGEAGDGDGDPQGLSVELLLNSGVIRETNNDGALTASCMLFDGGLPAAEQPEFEYAVTPAQGVTDNGDSWSFEEFGTWSMGCNVVGDPALASEREFAVLNDAVDARLAEVGAALGTSQAALAAVLAADGGDDQQLVDAITTLATAEPTLVDAELASLTDVLVALPGGYPNAAALGNAGIVATADDDAFTDALLDVDAALDQLAATYASFDPQVPPTAEDLGALEAAGAELDAALAAASGLELSAHGTLGNRETLATSIREHLAPTLVAIDAYVIARAEAEADALFGIAPPSLGVNAKFGLLSLSLGMFNQSYIRVKLVNEWYGDVIKDLDKSINNLILADLIDYWLPANPNGPVIDILQASASIGYALPGYDTWAYGSYFNSDPAFNVFIILGDQWQGVVDSVLDGCGVSEENSIPENVEAMNDCIDQTEQAVDSAINTPMAVIEPGTLGGQDVHLGPFPAVCEGFLPVATLVIPVNLAVGRGETWFTNCLP